MIPSTPQVDSSLRMTASQRAALQLLNKASDVASEQSRDIWQFALEIEQLHAVGLSNTELRQLLCLEYLEHARECTTNGSAQRVFQPLSTLVLPRRACFVLTAKGREAVSGSNAEKDAMVVVSAITPSKVCSSPREVPHWDSKSRQLWWRDYLIKEFRRPAVNQETILAILEEEGWPEWIDDPLPQTPGIDPKIRLHDTIKNLNRHHLHAIICFRGDGSGTGVGWMIVRGHQEMLSR